MPKQPANVEGLEDACSNAAYKINVVLKIIHSELETTRGTEDDDGGFGLCAAEDLLRQLRTDLRASAKAAEKERKELGGAR